MKTIKSLLSIAIVALATVLPSCTNQSQNPAQEFASKLDKLTDEVKDIKSEQDFAGLQEEIEASDRFVKEHAAYVLTDDDRKDIKDAMSKFFQTSFEKSFELAGQDPAESQIEMMVNMITAGVDRAKTLGDLSNPIEDGESDISDGMDAVDIEETIDIVNDSTAVVTMP